MNRRHGRLESQSRAEPPFYQLNSNVHSAAEERFFPIQCTRLDFEGDTAVASRENVDNKGSYYLQTSSKSIQVSFLFRLRFMTLGGSTRSYKSDILCVRYVGLLMQSTPLGVR